MDERIYILLIVFAILFALGTWAVRGSNDRQRIRGYIQSRGGKVVSISDGDKDRTYVVRYFDRDGNKHQARCHTTGWIGVFFADDQIVERRQAGETTATLEEENRRLREELARLKRKDRESTSDAIEE